jgi:hypothetical protein
VSDLQNLNLSLQEEKQISGFDSIVGLHYRTESDIEVVNAASSVLAKITGGVVIEAESGVIMNSADALAWARGEYEPIISTTPSPASTQIQHRRLSSLTIAKLVSLVLIAAYWIYLWAKG